jgi:hypothetical protein
MIELMSASMAVRWLAHRDEIGSSQKSGAVHRLDGMHVLGLQSDHVQVGRGVLHLHAIECCCDDVCDLVYVAGSSEYGLFTCDRAQDFSAFSDGMTPETFTVRKLPIAALDPLN